MVDRILLTLWVGGIWAIGYLAVPILFHALDDRHLAGELAGQMFRAVNFIGLGCGLMLIASITYVSGKACLHTWRLWVLILMLLLTCVGLFVLQPIMAELKMHGGLIKGSEQASQFGKMHGVSSVLYLVTSLCGLALVIFGLRSRR